jgi:hypothetical protein
MNTKKRYVIQTLTPGTGYSAVWAHDYGGNIQIEIRPLDFIAAVDVQHYRDGKWIDDGSDVVGVVLCDGFFEVVTDFANCHGIVRDGASWAECLDLLPPGLASRVVKPDATIETKQDGMKGHLLNV